MEEGEGEHTVALEMVRATPWTENTSSNGSEDGHGGGANAVVWTVVHAMETPPPPIHNIHDTIQISPSVSSGTASASLFDIPATVSIYGIQMDLHYREALVGKKSPLNGYYLRRFCVCLGLLCFSMAMGVLSADYTYREIASPTPSILYGLSIVLDVLLVLVLLTTEFVFFSLQWEFGPLVWTTVAIVWMTECTLWSAIVFTKSSSSSSSTLDMRFYAYPMLQAMSFITFMYYLILIEADRTITYLSLDTLYRKHNPWGVDSYAPPQYHIYIRSNADGSRHAYHYEHN